MAIMPGAKWRPLGKQTQPRLWNPKIVCIHTMVGYLDGTHAYFKKDGYKGTESHFGTGWDGTIVQWQDTAFTADANWRGSSNVISIENADHGGEFPRWNTNSSDVPPFSPHQVESIARILVWCHKEHGIPLRVIKNTRKGQSGVGWHSQGVPGNGLVRGGVPWSKYPGKICPGPARIAQIPQIVDRALQLARNEEDEDMPNIDEIRAVVREEALGAIRDSIPTIVDRVLNTPLRLEGATPPGVDYSSIAGSTRWAYNSRKDIIDSVADVVREETERVLSAVTVEKGGVPDGDDSTEKETA